MGTTKRKSPTKKRAPRRQRGSLDSVTLTEAGRLVSVCGDFEVETEDLMACLVRLDHQVEALAEAEDTAEVLVTSEILAACKKVQDVVKVSKDAMEKVKAYFYRFRDKGASFDQGGITVQFNERLSTSPKWKDEAIRLARELAAVNGTEFSEKVFVENIQRTYPVTTSKGIKFV